MREYIDILKKSSILVAEDDPKVRASLVKIISRFCDTIYEATNGDEALNIYKKEKPAIIFTDLQMPLKTGLELTRFIREEDDEIPIILMSAHSEKDALLAFISLGITEYLLKPATFTSIEQALIKSGAELEKKGLVEFCLGGDRYYSYSQKAIIEKEEIVKLTPKEIKLLELFIQNKNSVVSKEYIEQSVYEGDLMTDSAVNNLVSKVRKKISGKNKLIKSVGSMGFMLTVE